MFRRRGGNCPPAPETGCFKAAVVIGLVLIGTVATAAAWVITIKA